MVKCLEEKLLEAIANNSTPDGGLDAVQVHAELGDILEELASKVKLKKQQAAPGPRLTGPKYFHMDTNGSDSGEEEEEFDDEDYDMDYAGGSSNTACARKPPTLDAEAALASALASTAAAAAAPAGLLAITNGATAGDQPTGRGRDGNAMCSDAARRSRSRGSRGPQQRG